MREPGRVCRCRFRSTGAGSFQVVTPVVVVDAVVVVAKLAGVVLPEAQAGPGAAAFEPEPEGVLAPLVNASHARPGEHGGGVEVSDLHLGIESAMEREVDLSALPGVALDLGGPPCRESRQRRQSLEHLRWGCGQL